MTPLEQITYDIVKELQDKCEAEHRYPVCVSIHEITTVLNERTRAALNSFISNGTMAWHRNVNKIPMFKITNPDNGNN